MSFASDKFGCHINGAPFNAFETSGQARKKRFCLLCPFHFNIFQYLGTHVKKCRLSISRGERANNPELVNSKLRRFPPHDNDR